MILPSDIFSKIGFIADVFSLIGFVITLLVFRKVRSIQRDFLYTARVPELLNQLIEDRESLGRLLNLYKGRLYVPDEYKDSTRATLATCLANVVNLKPKLKGDSRKSAKDLEERIEKYFWNDFVDEAVNVYGKLNGLIASLENDLKDKKWIKSR